jgi:hypothetical protein
MTASLRPAASERRRSGAVDALDCSETRIAARNDDVGRAVPCRERRRVTSVAVRICALSLFAGPWLHGTDARAVERALAPAPASVPCDAQASGENGATFACPLTGLPPQRYRFVARFGGVHDDTMATMKVTLDGDRLECEPGSKTGFDGEESGEIALECRLVIDARSNAKPLLQVALTWYHAQYLSAELLAD